VIPSFWAILSTLLFSLSTPLSKILSSRYPPLFLAGLFYGGSALGALVGLIRPLGLSPESHRAFWEFSGLARRTRLALAGSVLAGGVVAPALFVRGLSGARASAGSLLMNAEGILTVILAVILFRERLTFRLLAGTVLGAGGCALLSLQDSLGTALWALPFLGAAFLWALDSNLLRFLSGVNPLVLTVWKGVASSLLLLSLSARFEIWRMPSPADIGLILAVGGIGYGASLVFFIRSIRLIGVSRTGAWFSFSPFFGAALSLVVLGEPVPGVFVVAAGILLVAAVLLSEKDREA
jgi:drug/metabolite transporter (DMT)-like permease